MSTDISFDENKYKIKSRTILGESQVPGMTKFLLDKGIVKSEKTAHTFLTTISLLFFISAIYVFSVFVFDFNTGNKQTLTPEQVQEREKIRTQRQERINNAKKNQ